MPKTIIKAAVFLLILTGMFTGTRTGAQASDNSHYGQLDPFTGRPVGESSTSDQDNETEEIVRLSDKMHFNIEKRMYGYPVDNTVVYSNVADGMIVRDRVILEFPKGITAEVLKDGTKIELDGQEIYDPGNYAVKVAENGSGAPLFTFTITKSRTGKILNYTVPEGFRITHASLDGDEISYSRKFVDMSEEGYYSIEYECYLTGMTYSLNITVDTTPPSIELVGVEEDGKARGPVTITGLGEDDILTVLQDGEPMSLLMTYTLTQSGVYDVIVTDDAGNSSSYRFTVMIYLDRNAWIFLLIFVLLIIGIIVYIQYQRTHLRIR